MDKKYKKYLASDEWKAKREERMRMDRYLCVDCGSPWNLVVHHETYENIYHEKMEDLVTLCRKCHRVAHGKDGEFDPDTFWWGNIREQNYNSFEMFSLLKNAGGEFAVLGYILEKKNEDNFLTIFINDVSKETGTPRNQVQCILEKFKKCNFISFKKRSRSVTDIFVNPALGVYGGEDRKGLLLVEYYKFKKEAEQ